MRTNSGILFVKKEEECPSNDACIVVGELEIYREVGKVSEIVDRLWGEFSIFACPIGISPNKNLLFELEGTLGALHEFDKKLYGGGMLEAGLIPPLKVEEKEKIELEHKYVLIKETYNRCDLEKAEVVGYYDEYPGVPQKEFVGGCLCCYITHSVGEIINAKG